VLTIRLSDRLIAANPHVLAVPVVAGARPAVPPVSALIHADLRAQIEAFLADSRHTGKAGSVRSLPRPLSVPRRVICVGVGENDEAGWRRAGAALSRAAGEEDSLAVALPEPATPPMVQGLAEGLWLASYTFNLAQRPQRPAIAREPGVAVRAGRGRQATTEVYVDPAPDETLRRVTLLVTDAEPADAATLALQRAYTVTTATRFARDLTNMPSEDKTPGWFADQVAQIAAGNAQLEVGVVRGDELASRGFGGIAAVGRGSARPPCLLELSWRPPGATTHVVLVGKGITFDSGGLCIKPRDGMKLMRKDMGGAAAIVAATLGAAELDIPVRITALAPLAENSVSGTSFRPGDIVRHYGGRTSEILNTDAEGRLVLADALAYAAEVLRPDVIVDLATLTGANAVALGKRTAALYSDNDALAAQLCAAADAAGERAWRMPLYDDYLREIRSDVADIANSSDVGGGSIMAALFLREFTGDSRPNWAHLDMSAPSWSDTGDGELVKGATGWGVRTLLRWLAALPEGGQPEGGPGPIAARASLPRPAGTAAQP
jgi:leucyl aminopeptidase